VVRWPVLVMVLSSSAFVIPPAWAAAPDLVPRLPQVFQVYDRNLHEQGRGDELGMTADQKFEASLGGRWFGPKDSTWTQAERSIEFPKGALARSYPADTGFRLVDTTQTLTDDTACREIVAARFQLGSGKSLIFTLGHATEDCTDDPWMLWTHAGHRFRHALPDLFGYNVQGLWYTGEYVILNIRVDYEFGGVFEGLAFWNLEQGWMRTVVAETHVGAQMDVDDPIQTDPTQGLGVDLRDLSEASLMESNGAVYVSRGDLRLVFWPERTEWMAIP
jgi:hypothetical protein